MKLRDDQWTMAHLRQHFQAAVELEMWTIPYYMSAMFSIKDRASEAYQLIQSVVNQEMLHVQLVANAGNAFGFKPSFPPPVYQGQSIPHLDFRIDKPDPRKEFSPYSAEIGPLDELRINGMCLVEYPEWKTGHKPQLKDTVSEYGSIGEFYDALEYGMAQFASEIRGGVRQVDLFSSFYRNMPKLTVEGSGRAALRQVALLIDAIRDQGEGSKTAERIDRAFQNTADDSAPELAHYEKFIEIRKARSLPRTYSTDPVGAYTREQKRLEKILIDNFIALRRMLKQLFGGKDPGGFEPLMVTVGGNILNCWKNGVTPRFSHRQRTRADRDRPDRRRKST